MPNTGTPRSNNAGSSCGAPSAYTLAGPPDNTTACGCRALISAIEAVFGMTSEKTRASRTRRAINWAYCAPKSTTSPGRSTGPAFSSSAGSATSASLVERKCAAHRIDGILVAVEFDAPEGSLALGVARLEAAVDQIGRGGGDRHGRVADSAREATLPYREFETAAVDLDAVCGIQTSTMGRVEAQQDSGKEPVERRHRANVDRIQPVHAEPCHALQDGQHTLPAHVAEGVDGTPDRGRQVGTVDQSG